MKKSIIITLISVLAIMMLCIGLSGCQKSENSYSEESSVIFDKKNYSENTISLARKIIFSVDSYLDGYLVENEITRPYIEQAWVNAAEDYYNEIHDEGNAENLMLEGDAAVLIVELKTSRIPEKVLEYRNRLAEEIGEEIKIMSFTESSTVNTSSEPIYQSDASVQSEAKSNKEITEETTIYKNDINPVPPTKRFDIIQDLPDFPEESHEIDLDGIN